MYLKNSASRCRVAKVLEMTKALTWKFVQVADDIVVYLPSLYTVINEVNDDEDDHRSNKRNERSELITNITVYCMIIYVVLTINQSKFFL